jgi:hypothetical protein
MWVGILQVRFNIRFAASYELKFLKLKILDFLNEAIDLSPTTAGLSLKTRIVEPWKLTTRIPWSCTHYTTIWSYTIDTSRPGGASYTLMGT